MENLTKALELLSQKQYSSAIEEFNKALEEDTNNIDIFKNLGLCYFNLKNHSAAVDVFIKALKIDENDATVLYYLASLSVLENNTEDAILYSKKVIELRPEFFDAYKILFTLYLREKRYKDIVNLEKIFTLNNVKGDDDTIHQVIATTYMIDKNYETAIEFLNAAKSISPNKVQTYNNLGICYMSLKNYDEALNMFLEAIKLDDKNVLAYTDLGTVLQIKGEFLKALEAFKKALQLEPDSFLNLLNVANLSNLLRRYDLAIEAYESLLKINPQLKEIENSLIGAYVKNNQPDKAINLIDVALKSNPKNVPLLFRKAKIFTAIGDYNAATKVYEQILAFKKTSPTIYHAYAILYTKMKDYDKALQYLNKSLTLDDKNASVHKDFGIIYTLRNQVEYAKDEFDKAAELGQDDNEILKECADFYYSISDFSKAEELYKKSLELENNPFTKLSLGINYIAQNRLEEAFATLEPLMSILPDNPELLYNLSRIFYAQKDFDKAARLAKKAYFVIPTIEIANLLGLCLKNLDDYKGAANIFDKIIEKYPLNTFVYMDLIECYKKLDDKRGLAKTYEIAVNNLPHNEEYVIELVNNLIALNNNEKAKEVFYKAYFEHPTEKLKELEKLL